MVIENISNNLASLDWKHNMQQIYLFAQGTGALLCPGCVVCLRFGSHLTLENIISIAHCLELYGITTI